MTKRTWVLLAIAVVLAIIVVPLRGWLMQTETVPISREEMEEFEENRMLMMPPMGPGPAVEEPPAEADVDEAPADDDATETDEEAPEADEDLPNEGEDDDAGDVEPEEPAEE